MSASIEAHEIRIAESEEEVRSCWPAFKELRPHLRSADELVERWRTQVDETYKIAYVAGGDPAPAAVGYRLMHTLAWGRIVYIDDLIALESRHGTGLGTALLRFVYDQAEELGCAAVHLDTGYQRHRAHRAYLRNGFRVDCLHLAWQIDGD